MANATRTAIVTSPAKGVGLCLRRRASGHARAEPPVQIGPRECSAECHRVASPDSPGATYLRVDADVGFVVECRRAQDPAVLREISFAGVRRTAVRSISRTRRRWRARRCGRWPQGRRVVVPDSPGPARALLAPPSSVRPARCQEARRPLRGGTGYLDDWFTARTCSPACLSHLVTTPSLTPSPSLGMANGVVMPLSCLGWSGGSGCYLARSSAARTMLSQSRPCHR
jgi:hypothetical protein